MGISDWSIHVVDQWLISKGSAVGLINSQQALQWRYQLLKHSMIILTEARTCKASIVVCIRPIINSFCRSRLSKIILSINRTCCGLVSQWCSHQFSPTKSMVKYWILCKQMLSKHLVVSVFHMMSTRGQYTGLQGHVKMELALTIHFKTF